MQIAVISFLGYNNSIIRNRRGRKKMGFIAVVIVFASLGYDMYPCDPQSWKQLR